MVHVQRERERENSYGSTPRCCSLFVLLACDHLSAETSPLLLEDKFRFPRSFENITKWPYSWQQRRHLNKNRHTLNNSSLHILDTHSAAGLRCLSESAHQERLPVADRSGCKDYSLHVSRWSISSGQSRFNHYYKIFNLKGAIKWWCSDSCWSGTLEWAGVIRKLAVKVKFSLETPLTSVRRYQFPLCGSLCRALDQELLPWGCRCRYRF